MLDIGKHDTRRIFFIRLVCRIGWVAFGKSYLVLFVDIQSPKDSWSPPLLPVCPPTIPLWQIAIGIVQIVIGKEIFGGVGMNILNPALTARAFLFFAYPAEISGDKPGFVPR